jgi:hypothetical protein
MPLIHAYVIVGFYFISSFYEKVFEGFISKSAMRYTTVLVILLFVFLSVFVQPIFTFNSIALTIESVFVIVFSLSTYILLINDLAKKSWENLLTSLHWINSGLFIYFTSSLLIFFVGDLITQNSPSSQSRYTWLLHAFFSSLMYFCFFAGLWNRPRKSVR